MPRGLVSANTTAIISPTVRPVYLVKAEFDSGDSLVWSGVGDITFDGDTYTGVGTLLSISSFSEQMDLKAASFTVSVQLEATALNLAKTEDYQNRFLTVFVGFLDDSNTLVADPQVLLKGFMDQMEVIVGDGQASISITCENRLIDLQRPRRRLYTDSEQKSIYPNDRGFEYVAAIADVKLDWGKG